MTSNERNVKFNASHATTMSELKMFVCMSMSRNVLSIRMMRSLDRREHELDEDPRLTTSSRHHQN
jgi:hypothetical protein